jgi:amino acid adenylation domain-containing protein
LEAYALQDLPFERLVEELQPARDPSRTPLFQAMLILQNAPSEGLSLPGLALSPLPAATGAARLDLLLSFSGADSGVLEYSSDLFDRATAERVARHLGALLTAAVADPGARLSELPLLSGPERAQLLEGWNDTAGEVPSACVHQLVAVRAAMAPDAVAVSGTEWMSYGDLTARAGRLAGRLRALGVGPDVVVGVALERSPALLVALLGVLAAGGAYLPLDPAYPAERLAFMLSDAAVPVLLSDRGTAARLPAHGARILLLDGAGEGTEPVESLPVAAPAMGPETGPDHLAYVIYTSGSTGRPKGVQVTHGALTNLLVSLGGIVRAEPADVLLAVTSLSFDIAALELFLPLLHGARVELVPAAVAADGPRLRGHLRGAGATVLQATPSTWRMLLEAGGAEPGRLRLALTGGEPLDHGLASRLGGWAGELWNVYGPTETTVWSTAYRIDGDGRGDGISTISIGRPIANTGAYVLDARLHPLPAGVSGELYLGGAGVARGYLGRPALTAERFIPDPFGGRPGGRLYRTGDRVRYRADGRLEFLGRADHQVKVRGFRIEPGEVEDVLARHPAVRAAAVVLRDDLPGGPGLAAYLAGAGEAGELRAFLRERLPTFMVPSAFVFLEALPLTPNGKVDRRSLPAPGRDRIGPEVFVAPRSPLEENLAAIWSQVLGQERIGVHDDFFLLGGHSLLAMQVLARVRQELQVELPVHTLFEAPTVASLAASVVGVLAEGVDDSLLLEMLAELDGEGQDRLAVGGEAS